MSRYALAGVALLSCVIGTSWAQDASDSNQALEGAVITKLTPLIYPPLARQTRITGNVELRLEVRKDGSVASAVVVSGHPLLRQKALENEQQSQFACNDCSSEDVRSYRLVYTFELGPTSHCTDEPNKSSASPEQSYPRLTQSQGHVTLVDQPVGTCDLAGTIKYSKVRSAKCLYLWKCAKPRLIILE
jgi:TonB family protein